MEEETAHPTSRALVEGELSPEDSVTVVPTAGGCFNKSSNFLSVQMQSNFNLIFKL